jgi:hypothetical protein
MLKYNHAKYYKLIKRKIMTEKIFFPLCLLILGLVSILRIFSANLLDTEIFISSKHNKIITS